MKDFRRLPIGTVVCFDDGILKSFEVKVGVTKTVIIDSDIKFRVIKDEGGKVEYRHHNKDLYFMSVADKEIQKMYRGVL